MEYTISINISGNEQELNDVHVFMREVFDFVQAQTSLGLSGSVSCECAPRAIDPHWISLIINIGGGVASASIYEAIKYLIKSFAKMIQSYPKFKGFVYLNDKKGESIKLENSVIESQSDIRKMIEELDQVKQYLEKQLQDYDDNEEERC